MNLGTNDGFLFTSSPIEGFRPIDNTAAFSDCSPSFENLVDTTWSALLRGYKEPPTLTAQIDSKKKEEDVLKFDLSSEQSTCTESSASFQPIAEHKMKVLLTPGNKIKILSNSSRKIHRPTTPMKPSSYSKLSQNYHQRFEMEESDGSEEEEESVHTIKQRLKTKENLTMQEVERYEKILTKHISQKKKKTVLETKLPTDIPPSTDSASVLMQFLEQQLGRLDLSPSSLRTLRIQNEEQEKRLISLSITKRKSAAEIKQRIEKQQATANQQVLSVKSK